MRVALARLLLARPDLLLLDEPTNHLDLESLEWLEGWIADYPGTVIVVSHDRYFLNRSARQITEMARGRLTHFAGDYDAYLVEKARRAEALEAARRQQDREIARKSRFIERFRYKNTKARQVQSRIKQLEKIERIETESDSRGVRFRFQPPPRSGEEVVKLEGLVKRFGEKVVYEGIDLLVRRGERIALMGPNGTGKTTLLRVLAGELLYEGGRHLLGHNVSVGYYAQHQLDALDPGRSVLAELATAAPAVEQERLRSVLGAFLFSGDEVDKRVAVLSGGEKARLALAKLLMNPANLLLLDEPTNHLDLLAREVLEDALNDYPGTLLVVSHDRYFINRVVTETLEVGRHALVRRPGDYDEYERARAREAEALAEAAAEGVPESAPAASPAPAPEGAAAGGRKSREPRPLRLPRAPPREAARAASSAAGRPRPARS
jgi:ATP-binding cassette subfamily F protein 3